MKILIADDDVVSRLMLEAALKRWGFDVIAAADGQEAWDILQTPDSPKLAILDWMMPNMDGLEVCRHVRQQSDRQYVYIILLTAKVGKGDLIKGMDAGADDYLTKPFNGEELKVRLCAGRRMIELQEQLLASKKALMEKRRNEVQIGAKIQETLLLGKLPETIPGLDISAVTIPSEEIDGDFYDFIRQGESCLDVVIGDVMGKGVPAALLGAAFKAHLLREMQQLMRGGDVILPMPQDVVMAVHRRMTRHFIDLEKYITVCYGRFDNDAKRLDVVDCGHAHGVHYRTGQGGCELLPGRNVPLGFAEAETYCQDAVQFDPGDVFLFFSDGVTEARNAAGKFFGQGRLETVFVRAAESQASAAEINSRLIEAVREFTGSPTFADDVTCVTVRVTK